MNKMTWEKEESRERKVRARRTPRLHSRGVGEALGVGQRNTASQNRRVLEGDSRLEVVKGDGVEAQQTWKHS